jgi:hypothetical protein
MPMQLFCGLRNSFAQQKWQIIQWDVITQSTGGEANYFRRNGHSP